MSETTEYRTYITMGENYAQLYAEADAALELEQIEATATRIIEAYRTLDVDPAVRAETSLGVPLRLIRTALNDPREYVDAALRHLDTQPAGFPFVEITWLDDPTPADMAAACFIALPDGADEAYMVTLLTMEDEDPS
jgi:hypothetical protein